MGSFLSASGTMRGPFLFLAVACTLPGLAMAQFDTGTRDVWSAILIVIAAVAGHVSVNAFNEVDDFLTGLDERTERTPFSGGSGTLQERPDLLPAARAIAWTGLIVASGIGAWFIWLRGPVVALIGAIGVVTVLGYSRWFVRSPFLCLVAPGVGFGTVITLGSYAALTGTVTRPAVLVSLIPLMFVNNLLLLNQFPDVEADRTVGRKHLPIVWGKRKAAWAYGAMHAAAYVFLGSGILLQWFPVWTALGFATLPLAAISTMIALKHHENRERFLPALGQNVLVNLLTPALIALGYWLG